MPLVNCQNCQTEFNADQRELNIGNGKFCSLKCAGQYRSKTRQPLPPNAVCAYCQKPFRKKKSQSKSGLYFCCREHKDLAQRLNGLSEIMPPHYGQGNGISSYRKLAFAIHPNNCAECGYDQYLEILEVHHNDGDRNNNPPDGSNWTILCPTHHREVDFKRRGII